MNTLRIFGGVGITLITFGFVLILYGTKKIKMIGGAVLGIGVGICYICRFPFE